MFTSSNIAIDWLIDWLMKDWSIDWLIDWLIDWRRIGRLIDCLVDWLIDWMYFPCRGCSCRSFSASLMARYGKFSIVTWNNTCPCMRCRCFRACTGAASSPVPTSTGRATATCTTATRTSPPITPTCPPISNAQLSPRYFVSAVLKLDHFHFPCLMTDC